MFKEDFKYYKSKRKPPDFSNVLNFSTKNFHEKVKSVNCIKSNVGFFGLIPSSEWECFEILRNPGLIFIKNPFTSIGQRYWITRSIADYSKKPNKNNLDIHKIIPEDCNWWEYGKHDKDVIPKLRWATLGYHHNWDTKIYSDDSKNDFPEDLSQLCQHFSKTLGFESFTAEAAIVNYYHMDSTLSGHTDHSEKYLEAPLFSFSFGQTALFLIGGANINVKPTALFLHSGDVIVMSKESRLCYHGVPRILPCEYQAWKTEENEFECKRSDLEINCHIREEILSICYDETKWKRFDDYMSTSRININVRQVLNHTEKNV